MQTQTETVQTEVTTYTANVRIPRVVGKAVAKIKARRAVKAAVKENQE